MVRLKLRAVRRVFKDMGGHHLSIHGLSSTVDGGWRRRQQQRTNEFLSCLYDEQQQTDGTWRRAGIRTSEIVIACCRAGIRTSEIVIAYDPVWENGTGKVATPAHAQGFGTSCCTFNFFTSALSLKDVVHSDDFSILLNSSPSLDQRLYNSPTASQVAAVWIEDYDRVEDNRNIRVYAHCGRSQNIQYYYGCYDPLQYPLLFPFGDVGWHEGIQRALQSRNLQPLGYVNSLSINANTQLSVDDLIREEEAVFREGRKRSSISCREYYAYKFHIRASDNSLLLHTGRLFQQFIVDIYIKVETQRLDYFRKKQQLFRSENFQGLVDSVGTGAVFGNEVGRRVILPSSFIGGPRDMRGRYMDAMSLVQNFGKPDMDLQYNDDAQNRPDLIARVFHAKLQELKNDITKKQFFGEIAAYTYVIEFQKRGLPHAHFLIILKDKCHAMSPSFVDNFVSAEIPDKHLQPALYDLVKKHMVHGPCGFLNPNCPCMTQRKCKSAPTCKSKYPKLFSDATEFADDSYPIYKRRNTPFLVHVKGFNLDNRWIVPYNPQLLHKFDCHINVKVCASIKSVKYIYKYIYKGHDRVSMTLGDNTDDRVIDEIKEYQNARWISPPEAAWRIFGFAIAEMKPVVIQLQIHLENSQYINFYGHERITYIVSREESSRTMLTEFFAMNLSSDFARTLNLLYVEFPCHFVWCKSSKSWKPRKQLTVIGRLVAVNPTEGERYYLRLLLMNVRAPTSFDCLRTVNGQITSSFRDAAEKLGLLVGDFIVETSLNEAVLFQMPSSLRTFFATLLIFCDISNPISLWMKYKTHMCQDLLRTGLHTNAEAESLVLKMIPNIVQEMGKKTKDFCLFDLLESYDFPGRVTNEILVENMRARADPTFASYLMKIGNGTEPAIYQNKIKVPSQFLVQKCGSKSSLYALFDDVYTDLHCFFNDPYPLMDRAILTTKNEFVDEINMLLLEKFPGENKSYISYDEPLDSKLMQWYTTNM
ncbi:uncharacterized protein LOC115995912 [Ipomoea triloba]|uniref:uncharacterized protein LOC115995912 n=1 Tax=Ipomoea triloba TaxID=35885 RepID=UPI00125DB526|nr:uncharacterized protein LOC115995912 [Ipomoea triloba]